MARHNPIYTNAYHHPEDTGLHTMGRIVNFGDADLATGLLPCGSFEKNSVIDFARVSILTAFNAGTTNTLEFGTVTNGTFTADIMSAADTAAGTLGNRKNGTGAKLGAPLATDTIVYARFTQAGTAATAGQAMFWMAAFIPQTPDPRTRAGD